MTYNSTCHLKKANCASAIPIGRAHKGKCKKMQNDAVKIPVEEEKCPKFCDRMLAPVCGSDYQTYGNECALKMTACEQPIRRLVLLHDGPCKCPNICSREWHPVCGTDGEDYPSPCELKRAACELEESSTALRVESFGPCDQTASLIEPEVTNKKSKDCQTSKGCLRIYDPVCGVDGKDYQTSCHAENCGIAVAKKCKCAEPDDCPEFDFDLFLNDMFGGDFVEPGMPDKDATEAPEPITRKGKKSPKIPTEAPEKNCSKMCTREYKKTCGYSAKMGFKYYSNLCMMDVISREEGEQAVESSDPVCGMKERVSKKNSRKF